MAASNKQILPTAITSKTDLIRIKHELVEISEVFHQEKIKDQAESKLPGVSDVVRQLGEAFNVDVSNTEGCNKLIKQLEDIYESSPVIHISFSTSPKPVFLQKLVLWFRKEIHPTALVQIGLQPSIAAGCIVRTPNKQFDFSLRQFIKTKQGELIQSIRSQG